MMSMISVVGHAAMARWMRANLTEQDGLYKMNLDGLTAMQDGRFCSWQTVTYKRRQTAYVITITENS